MRYPAKSTEGYIYIGKFEGNSLTRSFDISSLASANLFFKFYGKLLNVYIVDNAQEPVDGQTDEPHLVCQLETKSSPCTNDNNK